MEPYVLIYNSEDGPKVSLFNIQGEPDIEELLIDPYEYAGIKTFLDEADLASLGDIESLEDGEGFLLSFKIKVPQPVTKQWRIQ